MRIAVTGATGQLGRLVRGRALETAHANLGGIASNPEKAARGVGIRRGDYSQPQTLTPALADVNRRLLVSGVTGGLR